MPSGVLMIQRVSDIHVIEFLDSSLLDQVVIERIREDIDEIVERSAVPKLVISFENVTFVSSAMLGVLMATHKKVAAKHGQLRVASIPPKILQVFTLTRLDKLLKITSTTNEAMKGL